MLLCIRLVEDDASLLTDHNQRCNGNLGRYDMILYSFQGTHCPNQATSGFPSLHNHFVKVPLLKYIKCAFFFKSQIVMQCSRLVDTALTLQQRIRWQEFCRLLRTLALGLDQIRRGLGMDGTGIGGQPGKPGLALTGLTWPDPAWPGPDLAWPWPWPGLGLA
jgi:hypothetical protein